MFTNKPQSTLKRKKTYVYHYLAVINKCDGMIFIPAMFVGLKKILILGDVFPLVANSDNFKKCLTNACI